MEEGWKTFTWNGRLCLGTDFHLCCLSDDLEGARRLAEEDASQITRRFRYATVFEGRKQQGSGEPIHLAAARGNVALTRWLLGQKASLEAMVMRNHAMHYNVMHSAVFHEGRSGTAAITKALLELKGDNQKNVDEKSVLDLACQTRACHLIPLLMEAWIDRITQNEVLRAFEVGVGEGNAAVIGWLLENESELVFRSGVLMVSSAAKLCLYDGPVGAELLNGICEDLSEEVPGLKTQAYVPAYLYRTVVVSRDELESHNIAAIVPQHRPWRDLVFLRGSSVAPVTLRCCRMPGICSKAVIKSIAETPSIEVPATDLAFAVVQEAWEWCQFFYHLEVLLKFIFLAILCHVTGCVRTGAPVPRWELACISLLVAKTAIDEFSQLLDTVASHCNGKFGIGTALVEYIFAKKNVFDCSRIFVDIAGAWTVTHQTESVKKRGIIAVWCFARWFHSMYALRAYAVFGPRLLPIVCAARDSASFFILMSFCLCGFTHAFYVLETRDGPSQLYAAFQPVFRLGFLGDFDLFELEGRDTFFMHDGEGRWDPVDPELPGRDIDIPTLVHIWFYVTSLVVTVVMMNLLVGILGNHFDRYEEQSRGLFVRERASLIMEMSAWPWWRGSLWRRRWEDGYLAFASRTEPSPENEISLRKTLENSMIKQTRLLGDATAARINRLDANVREMANAQRQFNDLVLAKLDTLLDEKTTTTAIATATSKCE